MKQDKNDENPKKYDWGVEEKDPKTDNDTTDTVDITDVLGEETIVKDFKAKESEEQETTQDKADSDDFAKGVNEPEPDKAEDNESSSQRADSGSSAKDNAEVVIGTLDGLFQMVLPIGYARKIFSEEDKEKLPEIKALFSMRKRAGFKAMYSQQPDEDKTLYDKYCVYVEFCDGVPFTDKETKLMSKPLEAVLKKHNWDTGPEVSLIMAMFMVTSSRIAPFIL